MTLRLLLLGSLGVLALGGCSEEIVKSPTPNRTPDTQISSDSPRAFAATSYQVHLNWVGEDADGRVVGYYYAWDDTLDEEGENAWQWTSANESTFVVTADSCGTPPCEGELSPFFDYHTFWVKSIDDQGAHDPTPAHRTFTATTVAPRCSITAGPYTVPGGGCGYVPALVFVSWLGLDSDGQVTGYWYKWDARLREPPPLPDPSVGGWIYMPAESTHVSSFRQQLVPGCQGRYNTFAVYAVDDAGAVQQVGEEGINWLCFCPDTSKSGPGVCIDGGVLGVRSENDRWCDPLTADEVGEVDRSLYSFSAVTGAFVGTGVRFTWGRLEWDIGEPAPLVGYRYSVDDPSAWSTLSLDVRQYPDSTKPPWYPDPGRHVFYVEAVDAAGGVDAGQFIFDIVEGPGSADPPLEPRILLIDDNGVGGAAAGDTYYFEWKNFLDRNENAFWQYALDTYHYDEWETNARGKAPLVPDIAQYTTVIWDAGLPTGERNKSYLRTQLFLPRSEYLSSYVRAGGNVVMLGMNPMEAMLIRSSIAGSDPTRGGDVCGNPPSMGQWMFFDPSFCGLSESEAFPHFIYTIMGVRRMRVAVSQTGQSQFPEDRIVRGCIAVEHDSLLTPFHEDLRIDSLKAGGPQDNPPGPNWVDYTRAPDVTNAVGMEDWVDAVYYLDSADPLVPTDFVVGLVADGSLNPRRRPTDPPWGKVVFIGIHPFFLHDEDGRELVNAVMEYLGEQQP